jgi:hypothetical protein
MWVNPLVCNKKITRIRGSMAVMRVCNNVCEDDRELR